MTFKRSDFSKICRMCLLISKELQPLQVPEMIEMIKNCTGIEVKLNDGLPQSMCVDCSEQIHKYSAFRDKCKNSDTVLHQIINEDDFYDSFSDTNDDCAISPISTKELTTDIKTELFDGEDNTSDVDSSLPIKKELEADAEIHDSCKTENINEIVDGNKCYVKDETFDNSKDDLDKQKSDTKRTKETVYCKKCKNYISKNLYENHMKEHGLKKYQKCDTCSRIFRKPCELAKHLNDVHKRKKTLECQVCSKKFHLQIQLDFHLKLHFKTKHICNVCGKEFCKSSKLQRHKKIHEHREKIFCLHCDKLFISDDSFKMHVKLYHSADSAGKIKKTCPICGKVVVNMKRHTMQMHSNSKAYQCDQCDKSFICNSLLTRHVEEKHLGIKKECKALCFICGKTCPSQGDLKKHLPMHDDNREYQCNLCNKKYKSRNGLRCHLKVHKGIRPFGCSYCSKKYFTNKDLQQHLYVHTGERPFACHICGRTFNYKAARWTHMKIHNNAFVESTKNSGANV